jgi:septal ring factor EnvC (AmiA/AmiB activator)
MTTEERFERIEHVTAALAEERRNDREEYRQLWRDTQRQFNEVSVKVSELTQKIADTNDTVNRLAEEAREEDRRLGARLDALVSAIGQFIANQKT